MISTRYISDILFDDDLDKSSYLNNLPIIKYLSKGAVSITAPFYVWRNLYEGR